MGGGTSKASVASTDFKSYTTQAEGKASVTTTDLKSFIQSEVQENQVVIWSKTWCGYCSRTKALFERPEFKDVNVKVHELDQMSNGFAIQSLLAVITGQRTVPSVWVGGKFIGGSDDTYAAYRTGRLQSMLGFSSKL